MKKEKEEVVAFVTKYALTEGILEVSGRISGDMFVYKKEKMRFHNYIGRGNYFFTKEEAVSKSDSMRLKKITSLEKQLNKIKNLKF